MIDARIYNQFPSGRLGSPIVNHRVTSFQTGRTGDASSTIEAGTPIGLLLVFTYPERMSVPPLSFSDFRPNVRIKTY